MKGLKRFDSPSKKVAPAAHKAVHEDTWEVGGDGGDLDPAVGLRVDVVHGLPGLLGVHREDGAAAVGRERRGVQVPQVSCADSAKCIANFILS